MAEKPQTEHLYSYNSPPPTYEESKYHQKLEEAPNLSAMDTEYTSQKVCTIVFELLAYELFIYENEEKYLDLNICSKTFDEKCCCLYHDYGTGKYIFFKG